MNAAISEYCHDERPCDARLHRGHDLQQQRADPPRAAAPD